MIEPVRRGLSAQVQDHSGARLQVPELAVVCQLACRGMIGLPASASRAFCGLWPCCWR